MSVEGPLDGPLEARVYRREAVAHWRQRDILLDAIDDVLQGRLPTDSLIAVREQIKTEEPLAKPALEREEAISLLQQAHKVAATWQDRNLDASVVTGLLDEAIDLLNPVLEAEK